MYCKNCNSLLNEENICPVCENDTSLKNNELSQAIDELKGGNQEAFNIFYNYTNKYVYSRAKTLSSDEQTANDVMQEVYIAAFKNINSLKTNDSVFAWLRTITFNASNRIMKKNKKEIILSEENEEMLEALPDENEQLEEIYMNKQDIEIIHACIKRLSNEYRIVLLAYYYDNLKVEEIAELLQISSGTVKSRLFTARKKLKGFIEEEENKNGYKLHSFGGLSLALALRKLLKDNMDNSIIDNNALYQSICEKLNSPVNAISSNSIAKPKAKLLNAFSSNLKNKIVYKIAEVGIKKVMLSTVAVVIATGVIGGTVAVVTSNSSEIVSSVDEGSLTETSSDEVSSETSSVESFSQTSTPNKNQNNSSTTSNKTQSSSTVETTAAPFDINAVYHTYVDTIIINQKTRYYGYIGYFSLNTSNKKDVLSKFDKYGIPYKEDFALYSAHSTEYVAKDGTQIWFIGPDTDRLVLRDETDLYMGKENGGVFGRTVKVIDGDGIIPENNISLDNCDILYTKKFVNYLGYDGYFVDEHTQEALKKGYSTYPTEYYNAKTGSNIKFVFASRTDGVGNEDLEIQRKAFEKGIGSKPVNIVQYADTIPRENYKNFKYDIDIYYHKDKDFDMKPGGLIEDTWTGDIEIYTIGKDDSKKEEIKKIYKDKYGEEYYREVGCFLLGYYYVDGYDGVCNVYTYYVYAP